jgi:hypothetical protein
VICKMSFGTGPPSFHAETAPVLSAVEGSAARARFALNAAAKAANLRILRIVFFTVRVWLNGFRTQKVSEEQT